MNISGIVVHAHPQDAAVLQGRLAALPGVDVHAATEDGKIVITIEDTPASIPSDILMSVQNMQGVLSAAMVYNYNDEMITGKPE